MNHELRMRIAEKKHAFLDGFDEARQIMIAQLAKFEKEGKRTLNPYLWEEFENALERGRAAFEKRYDTTIQKVIS